MTKEAVCQSSRQKLCERSSRRRKQKKSSDLIVLGQVPRDVPRHVPRAMSGTIPGTASSSGSLKRKIQAGDICEDSFRYQKSVATHYCCDRCGEPHNGDHEWHRMCMSAPLTRSNWERCSMCGKYAHDEHEFEAWWCGRCSAAFPCFAEGW